VTALLAASCIVTVWHAYPYYFPYFNPLGLGRPGYFLASDSNVDWNHALPDVRRFVEQHGLKQIKVDAYGMTDPAEVVPHAQLWNCQRPAVADGGEWVAVSANMILDAHNCSWLMQYSHQALAGGAMYAVHLPMPIPAPGTPGGPPLYSAQREFLTPIAGMDVRFVFVNIARHPEMLPGVAAMMKEQAGAAFRNRGHKPRAQSPTAP
jgi:hypothetical protein